MPGLTIDKFDLKIHERYAQDQKKLDPRYTKEASSVGGQSEIAGTSSIYASSLEQLFDTQIRNVPWGAFSPPPKYNEQSNRFFSYQILPTIHMRSTDKSEEEDQEKEEEKEELESTRLELLNRVFAALPAPGQKAAHFEKERTYLISLLESIKYLDKLLGVINARKRQLQKG